MYVYQIDNESELKTLRQVCQEVQDLNDTILAQIKEMHQLMISSDGVGLAANQVGIAQRFFVANIDGETPMTFINPHITATSDQLSPYEEGCLSIPGKRSKVIRPAAIEVSATNERGRAFNIQADGLLAVCIQHEIDHLNAVLFLDHIKKRERARILKHFGLETA